MALGKILFLALSLRETSAASLSVRGFLQQHLFKDQSSTSTPYIWTRQESHHACNPDLGDEYMSSESTSANAGTKQSLHGCQIFCEGVPTCMAITFYTTSQWCSLWSTPCKGLKFDFGAISEVITRVPTTTTTTATTTTTTTATTTTPAPTPVPTCEDGSTGTCTVAEDPHIEVFDGSQVSLTARSISSTQATSTIDEKGGDMWLVKSDRISLQARYGADDELSERKMFVRAIAVGGPFLKGNTIVVGPLEGKITYNDEEILAQETSAFQISEGSEFFVNATRGESSSLVQDLSKQNAGVEIKLPLGVKLIVNRLHHHVNLAVKMPPQESQDGLCGNFNGFAADDSIELSEKRFDSTVQPQDSLFTGLYLD